MAIAVAPSSSVPAGVGSFNVLGVGRPEPRAEAGYSFEHVVVERHVDGTTSQGRIDLYKRGCFVLESKQFQAKKEEAQLVINCARNWFAT